MYTFSKHFGAKEINVFSALWSLYGRKTNSLLYHFIIKSLIIIAFYAILIAKICVRLK